MNSRWIFQSSLVALVIGTAACSSSTQSKAPVAGPDLGSDETDSTTDADTVSNPASTESIAFGEIKKAKFSKTLQFRAFTFDGTVGQVIDAYADGLKELDTILYVYPVSRYTGHPFGYPIAQNDDTATADWTVRTNAHHNDVSSSVHNVKLPETRKYALVVTTYEQGYTGTAEVVVKAQASGAGAIHVTTAQLEASPSKYNGKRIQVTADVKSPGTMCTKMACSQSNPCCNQCSTRLIVGTNINLSDSTLGSYTCSGNECNVASNCKGFSSTDPGKYTFVGTFTSDGATLELKIDWKKAANCHASGCSKEICANKDMVSICIYNPKYACYDLYSHCDAQGDGECGWTSSNALQACLANGGP